MTQEIAGRAAVFRSAIERFLQERRDAKLEKLPDQDPKRDALLAQYQRESWIEDAARRVRQIQAVTHTLKPMHPDAKGTNLYCEPSSLVARAEVGSHVLDSGMDVDVVGNAAALDVYAFLKLEVEGQWLLEWMRSDDVAVKHALSDDTDAADRWIEAFTGLIAEGAEPTSHVLAKQLYWLVGDDPVRDDHFHLLAPLHASSFAHAVHVRVNEHRYGEEAKAARQARWNQQHHALGYADYPNLAAKKLGGTKPQNISQLNSERRGVNYLLGSSPPEWHSREVTEPWHVDSVFPRFGRRVDVKEAVRDLRRFLRTNPPSNIATRQQRDQYLESLIDALVGFGAQLQTALPAGWTLDVRCELVRCEQLWLDPGRAQRGDPDDEGFRADWLRLDWPEEIGHRFGNWLNAQLDQGLPVGDVEQRYWKTELLSDREWAAAADVRGANLPAAAAGGAP